MSRPPLCLKSADEIQRMRAVGRICAAILDQVCAAIRPGASTWDLEQVARRAIDRAGARSASLGYNPGGLPPYPAALCTSRNEVIVHGIPRVDEVLEHGDVVTVDLGIAWDGYCADAARTVGVGEVSADRRRLIDGARAALEDAIAACRPGNRLGDVGCAVQARAAAFGLAIVPGFVGHGIGRRMHEEPLVDNVGRPGEGIRLRPGLVLAIEPVLSAGGTGFEVLPDRWTVRSIDGSATAHVEHTVAITDDGPLVLTRGSDPDA